MARPRLKLRGKTMKKLNKVAMLFATAAMASAVFAAPSSGTETNDNWRNGHGNLQWRNGDGTLCWRNAFWTPATAAKGCDGAIVPAPAPAPALRTTPGFGAATPVTSALGTLLVTLL
jgi:OOP family OmpA-OmpF porin